EQLTEQHRQEIARVEKKLEHIVRQMSEKATRDLESAGEGSGKKEQKKIKKAKEEGGKGMRKEKERKETAAKKTHTPPTPAIREPGRAKPQEKGHPLAGGEGRRVRVVSLAVTGTITSIKDGEAEVLMGNIKLRRPLSDLEVIEEAAPKLPDRVHLSISP